MWRERAGILLDAVTVPGRFDAQRGLFRRRHALVRRHYEHLWPFACAWSAAETVADLKGAVGGRAAAVAGAAARGLAAYASASGPAGAPGAYGSSVAPPLGPGGDVFYDDNAWVALALLAHHRRTGDPRVLEAARRVVAFCCTGWSAEPEWVVPGGIRWKVAPANRSRNTCANGPVAEAAALVYLRTGDPVALAWAVRIYDWVRRALGGPDGLYLDRISPEGARSPERWTYNQGTMIGAGVLLAEATGDGRYLADARQTSAAALGRFDLARLLRPNGPAMNAIFFRNLFLLDSGREDPRIGALVGAYAEATWDNHLRACGARRGPAPGWLNASAPLAEVYALLGGAAPHP